MRKEFKSVLIGDNICVVDEKTELKRGDNYVRDNMIWLVQPSDNEDYYKNKSYPKIIAATNNSDDSFMSNLPRLVIKDEAEMLCEIAYRKACKTRPENAELASNSMVYPFSFELGFLAGFRANKKEFTREDIFNFIRFYNREFSFDKFRLHIEQRTGISVPKEYIVQQFEKQKPNTLLIEVDSDGSPIVVNNEIVGYKK